MKAIDSVAPIKKVRVKANQKPWFQTETIKNKLNLRCKNPGLEWNKDNFKSTKIFI